MLRGSRAGSWVIELLFVCIRMGTAGAEELPAPVCELVLHDQLTQLADARIAVDLARSDFAAYERIFAMIQGLRDAKTLPEMDYLKARYDRDAARLTLEQADLLLGRQDALVEQVRLLCGGAGNGKRDKAGAIRDAHLRYLRMDCEATAKAVDIADTRLEYHREYLRKIAKLRSESFATHTQVILAELDVEREEKNLADARTRTGACRAALAEAGIGR